MTPQPEVIPPITDEMGKYWDQPNLEGILIDDKNALMSDSDFWALSDYSSTFPSGVYDGKMWKRRLNYYDESKGWNLCWYGPSEDPNKCSINHRRILI